MPSRTTKTTNPQKVSRVGTRTLADQSSITYEQQSSITYEQPYPHNDNTTYSTHNDNTTYSTESYSCNGDCVNCQIACQWNKNPPFTWLDDKINPLNEPMEINEYIKRFKDKPTKKNKEKLKSIIEEENNLKKQKQEIKKQEKELVNKTKMLEKKEKALNTKEENLKKEQDIVKKEKAETQKLKKELYQNKELADILAI